MTLVTNGNENVFSITTVTRISVFYTCADPEKVGDRGSGPPLKNHKAIGFLSNTGLDPLKNHKATKPAFSAPSSACQ